MSSDDPLASLAPIPQVSTTTEVAHRLLEYVRSAELTAGSKLPPERSLAAQLGVPRSAVREALAALDLLGVIASRRGSGNYLSDEPSELLPQAIEWGLMLGRQRTKDLAEARQHIEVTVARLAATRATKDTTKALEESFSNMEIARRSPDDLLEADIRFHTEIATLAGNTVLSDILRSVRSLQRVWIRRGLSGDVSHADQTIEEHRAILVAISGEDPVAAGDAMSLHMKAASERLEQSFQNSAGAKESRQLPE